MTDGRVQDEAEVHLGLHRFDLFPVGHVGVEKVEAVLFVVELVEVWPLEGEVVETVVERELGLLLPDDGGGKGDDGFSLGLDS